MMTTPRLKPMRPLDRRIQVASVALADAKRCGVKKDIDDWTAKVDRLLDAKLRSSTAPDAPLPSDTLGSTDGI